MEPIEEASNVHIHDVSIFERGVVGDPVANHIVNARADRLWIPFISEGCRLCAVRESELQDRLIDLIGGRSRTHQRPGKVQCLRSKPSGPFHSLDK